MITTAWILPGGANTGAVQVGQAAALLDAGRGPDLLVGTSVGSLNAALLAAEPTPRGVDVLRRRWLEVRRRDVFPLRPLDLALGLAGRRDHLVSSRPLGAWLHAVLPFDRLEQAAVPLTVTATDLESGKAVHLERGPAVPALLASCALPGTFPPVRHAGRVLVDGAVAADVPVDRAVAGGADRVFVLSTVAPDQAGAPRKPMEVVMRAVAIALGTASGALLSAWADRVEIYVVPAPSLERRSPFDLSQSATLMDRARMLTASWLPVARPLGTAVPSPGAAGPFPR